MAETTQTQQPNASCEPYCGSCGYVLTGLTDSARCPECGKPLIDVLVRPGFAAPQPGKRYRSDATLFGLPIIDIAFGPSRDELSGHARGIIALGDKATGGIAIGGYARGVVAIGGFAVGGCSIGGAAIGLGTALGGAAIGGLATGGAAAGGLAQGGGAAGIVAQGGGAIGWAASGGGAYGVHTIGPAGPSSPAAQSIFDSVAWFFSTSVPTTTSMLQPTAVIAIITLAVAALIALVALISLRTSKPGRDTLDALQ